MSNSGGNVNFLKQTIIIYEGNNTLLTIIPIVLLIIKNVMHIFHLFLSLIDGMKWKSFTELVEKAKQSLC